MNATILVDHQCSKQATYGPQEMQLLMRAINKNNAGRHNKIPVIPVEAPSHDISSKMEVKMLFNMNCGRMSQIVQRIIGGTPVENGQWPFVVSLLFKSLNQFFCGGTLITSKHVLTGTLTNYKQI